MDSGLRTPDPPGDTGGLIVMVRPIRPWPRAPSPTTSMPSSPSAAKRPNGRSSACTPASSSTGTSSAGRGHAPGRGDPRPHPGGRVRRLSASLNTRWRSTPTRSGARPSSSRPPKPPSRSAVGATTSARLIRRRRLGTGTGTTAAAAGSRSPSRRPPDRRRHRCRRLRRRRRRAAGLDASQPPRARQPPRLRRPRPLPWEQVAGAGADPPGRGHHPPLRPAGPGGRRAARREPGRAGRRASRRPAPHGVGGGMAQGGRRLRRRSPTRVVHELLAAGPRPSCG